MNSYAFVILLGFVQGLTEFLPISSSGHLAMLENLSFFQKNSAEIGQSMSMLALNVLLHIGTILAVIFFWQKDLLEIIKDFFHDLAQKDWRGKGFRMVSLLFYSLLPILVIPFIKDYVENVTGSLRVISVLFILNGLMLVISDRFFKKFGQKHSEIHLMNKRSALTIGIFQALAVFPGISRSGSTITAGLIMGLNGKNSVKYSFIISIPVLLAASFLEGYDIFKTPGILQTLHWEWVISGILASFFAGIMSLKVLVWLGKKTIFYPFGIYTILLGSLLVLFF